MSNLLGVYLIWVGSYPHGFDCPEKVTTSLQPSQELVSASLCAVVVGDGVEGLLGLPAHVWVGRSFAVSVGLDEGKGVHVEVVAGFLAERGAGGDELGDERAIDPGGVEDGKGLDNLTGLHCLVAYIVSV